MSIRTELLFDETVDLLLRNGIERGSNFIQQNDRFQPRETRRRGFDYSSAEGEELGLAYGEFWEGGYGGVEDGVVFFIVIGDWGGIGGGGREDLPKSGLL